MIAVLPMSTATRSLSCCVHSNCPSSRSCMYLVVDRYLLIVLQYLQNSRDRAFFWNLQFVVLLDFFLPFCPNDALSPLNKISNKTTNYKFQKKERFRYLLFTTWNSTHSLFPYSKEIKNFLEICGTLGLKRRDKDDVGTYLTYVAGIHQSWCRVREYYTRCA